MIDLLRVVATLGVIAIHSDVITSSYTNYLGGISWWFVNIIHSFSRMAVPLFIMISGSIYLNPDKDVNFKQMLVKAITRLVLPYLIWLVIYLWWSSNWKGIDYSVNDAVTLFFSGKPFHLYFLPILAGLYLATPWLKKLNISKWTIFSLFAGTFLYQLVLYVVKDGSSLGNIFTLWIPYVSYFIAGRYLSNRKLFKPRLLILAVLVLGIITAFLYYQNILLYLQGNTIFWSKEGGQYFMEHFSPTIIPMTLITFYLLINMSQRQLLKNKKVNSAILIIAPLTYGIYLIHPIILDLLDHYARMAIHLISSNLWLYYLKKIFLTFSLSLVIISIIKKIPILKIFLGE